MDGLSGAEGAKTAEGLALRRGDKQEEGVEAGGVRTACATVACNEVTVKINYSAVSFEREAGSGVDGRG